MKKIFMATLVAATTLFTACHNSAPKANLKSDVDTVSYEAGIVMSPGDQLAGYLAQSGSDSASVDEFLKGLRAGIEAAGDKKKMAYYMGLMQGLQTKSQMLPGIESQIFAGDSTKKINIKNFLAGYAAAINGNIELQRDGKAVDREAANKHLMDYMFGKQKKESAEFLAAKKKEEGVKELNGGVLYKVLKAGEGDKKPAATDSVIVKYEGRLADGTVFDSSEHAPEGTATLSLQYMIEGWKIALPEMTVGSEWELYIPAELGYGERGTGPSPPYSALIFKVTLVGIK